MGCRLLALVKLEFPVYRCDVAPVCQASPPAGVHPLSAITTEGNLMPLVETRLLIDEAVKTSSGVCAFNIITLEHAEAVTWGAEASREPVILQISENAVRYHQDNVFALAAAATAVANAALVDVSLHLDHIEDDELLRSAADAGFSSVMYDASKLDYTDNVAATRRAADWAHSRDLYIEAELGAIGGKGGAHTPGVRTNPDEARRFVAATGVDALAVAVGSSHAMTSRTATLDHDLIVELRDAVPVPLVLHGSSGVADSELRSAIRNGIVKVNIGTILNVAFTDAVRSTLAADPNLVDPRKYLDPARRAVAEITRRLTAVTTEA
jgi:fructose-bisphosphate aldolase class II